MTRTLKNVTGLKKNDWTQVASFRNPDLARAAMFARNEQALRDRKGIRWGCMLGDHPHYWAAPLAVCQRLERLGYEWAPI